MNKQTLKLLFMVSVISLALIACNKSSAPTANLASVTTGHGAAIFQAQCLSCHGADIISSQRLSKTGWTKEVEKMTRWGAEVKDADKESLVEFLAASYPSRPFAKEPPAPPVAAPDANVVARGKALYEGKCLSCHGDDLVKQQRLSKIGWTKEVEKMVRWGAEVNDEEKAAMVEYLLAQNNSPKK